MMKNTIVNLIVLTIFFNSCELLEDKPKTVKEDPKPFVPTALNVLNENSGFSTIFDSAYSIIKNSNSSFGIIDLNDFSIEESNRLNVSYYTTRPSQQSTFRDQYRHSINLITNQLIDQLPNAGAYTLNPNTYYDKVVYKYLPYSNILGIIATKNSTGFGSYNSIEFLGDINGGISNVNPIGTGDFGYRMAVSNSSGGFGYFSTVSPWEVKSGSIYSMLIGGAGSSKTITDRLHEVYRGNNINEFFSFEFRLDSLVVYKINYTNMNFPPIYTVTQVNAIPTMNEKFGTLKRHYNIDGSQIAIMYTDYLKKTSTYVYDFNNNTLTQNLNQATLEYASTESDNDMDENGNVYYTGFANNGSNINGVSVYKKTGNSTAELVGTDNFLKSGAVVGLKHAFGKVYLAVTAKHIDGNVHQISFLKQN